MESSIARIEKLSKKYLNSQAVVRMQTFLKSNNVTITQEMCESLQLFSAEAVFDTEPIDEQHLFKIHGNSFAIEDADFLLNANYRIAVILKESYISKHSFDAGDRGHHNYSEEIRSIIEEDGTNTYPNLQSLLCDVIKDRNRISVGVPDIDVFLNHVAIINLNPFPGIEKISNIKKSSPLDTVWNFWADKSCHIIEELLEIINPQLVVCGGTLKYLLSDKSLFENVKNNNFPECSVLNRKIEKANVFDLNPYIGFYLDSKGTLWVDENHPASTTWSPEHISKLKYTIETFHYAL